MFEKYLQSIHAADYIGTDDDMPEAYEAWVSELDVAQVLEYAESYTNALFNKITARVLKYAAPLAEWNGMTAHDLVRNINFD
jgi:hypothetical protein